jgi:hypothetical protein
LNALFRTFTDIHTVTTRLTKRVHNGGIRAKAMFLPVFFDIVALRHASVIGRETGLIAQQLQARVAI